MNESTARVERVVPEPQSKSGYIWEVPQKPVSVFLTFEMIDRLEPLVVESFRSLTSRGSEIGGVLLGRAVAGSPSIVRVDDFELISCDYSRGPLYRLSDADMGRFERAIEQRTGSAARVVGFFRSHTRKGLSLDTDDVAFLDARFRDPNHVALLVRPFATKASTGGIFVRENGTIHTEGSYLEFPFRSSQLTPSAGPAKMESAPAAEAPSGSMTAVSAPPPPKPSVRGQIVPIASRREMAMPTPPAPEPIPAPPPVAKSAPAPAIAKSAPAPPPPAPAPAITKSATVNAPPAPAPKPQPPAPAPKPPAPKPPAEPVVRTEEKPIARRSEPAPAPARSEPAPTKAKSETVPASLPAKPSKSEPLPSKPLKTETAVPKVSKDIEKVSTAAAAAESPAQRGGGKLVWAVAILALAAVAGGGYVFYPGFHKAPLIPASAADTSDLKLSVEHSGADLLLTWDKDAPGLKNATHGTLQVSDGDRQEKFDIDPASGSIVYSPVTPDVSFQMEVTGANSVKIASGSTRVLRTRPSPMDDPKSQSKQSATAPETKRTETPTTATTPSQEETQAQEKPAAPAPAPRRFDSSSLAKGTIRPATSADLPDDAPQVGNGSSSPQAASLPGAIPGGIAPPPPPRQTAPPPPPAASKGMGGNISPAQLVFKRDPDYPKIAQQMGVKGVVELIATIGVDGKVKGVKVVKGPGMLQKAAQDAVMQWVYKPTLLNGTPVENETHISISFSGDK